MEIKRWRAWTVYTKPYGGVMEESAATPARAYINFEISKYLDGASSY